MIKQHLDSKEIKNHKEACKILANLMKELKKHSRAGISLLELDSFAYKFITNQKAKPSFLNYSGFPNSICISVNDILIHGIPTEYKLKPGDLLSIDAGVYYKNFHADAAFSMVIGENKAAQRLIDATNEALENAIKVLKPGVNVKEIGFEIQKTAKKYGYKLTHEYSGHGVGKNLHEDPIIFNYYEPTYDFILEENMTIAIEPMLLESTCDTFVNPNDNWSVHSSNGCLTAHAEHTILITKDGCEILTN